MARKLRFWETGIELPYFTYFTPQMPVTENEYKTKLRGLNTTLNKYLTRVQIHIRIPFFFFSNRLIASPISHQITALGKARFPTSWII